MKMVSFIVQGQECARGRSHILFVDKINILNRLTYSAQSGSSIESRKTSTPTVAKADDHRQAVQVSESHYQMRGAQGQQIQFLLKTDVGSNHFLGKLNKAFLRKR